MRLYSVIQLKTIAVFVSYLSQNSPHKCRFLANAVLGTQYSALADNRTKYRCKRYEPCSFLQFYYILAGSKRVEMIGAEWSPGRRLVERTFS